MGAGLGVRVEERVPGAKARVWWALIAWAKAHAYLRNNGKGKSNDRSRSLRDDSQNTRATAKAKARAMAKTMARAKANATTGVLRCVQDDGFQGRADCGIPVA
jgi:hypothetical protein